MGSIIPLYTANKQGFGRWSPAVSSFARRWPSSALGLRGTSHTLPADVGVVRYGHTQRHSGWSWGFQATFSTYLVMFFSTYLVMFHLFGDVLLGNGWFFGNF